MVLSVMPTVPLFWAFPRGIFGLSRIVIACIVALVLELFNRIIVWMLHFLAVATGDEFSNGSGA